MTARKPSCVVLGGGGFLGLNLCRRLASSGYPVQAFGRQCAFPEALGRVPWFPGEASDAQALASAIESCDVMIHLLGTTTVYAPGRAMGRDLHDNVLTALNCFDVASKLGVKRIVFISSGGTVYGVPTQVPIDETAPTEPCETYGISKLTIEKYLAVYERFLGVDYKVLRLANPFGPFQVPKRDRGVVATFISRALDDQPVEIWGDGSVVRDFVFVDDVTAAIELAINDTSHQRVFNIGSGQGRTLNDLVRALECVLGATLAVDWKQGRRGDVPVSILAIERATTVLGWAPITSFEQGLRQTVDWWRSLRKF